MSAHPTNAAATRPAIFLDRDGTIVRDVHYLGDPARVELLPGAAAALRRFAEAGYALVVVTNQSGIARGLFGEREYEAVRARLDALLAAEGVALAASYHCPHHPDFGGACACRKPGRLLFERAIAEHRLDPARSLFVGDRWRDIQPALHFGGRAILLMSDETPAEDLEIAEPQAAIARDLEAAATLVLPSGRG